MNGNVILMVLVCLMASVVFLLRLVPPLSASNNILLAFASFVVGCIIAYIAKGGEKG